MPQRGLTLLELLISLVILSLILAFAAPGFQKQIQHIQTRTLTLSLYEAIQTTRSRAVGRNGRATLRALGEWHEGWELFDDLNHNGIRDPEEALLLEHGIEGTGVRITATRPVTRYVSYLGTGESRYATGTPRGGWQGGTLKVCSTQGTGGYKLVLARMGRVRKRAIGEGECREG